MLDRCVKLGKTGLWAAASALILASTARAEDIQVPPDQVRVVTLTAPAKTVFVGNPSIADINVIDSTHIFVLGKNLGTTNIIALDTAGHEVINQQIVVLSSPGAMVTVQHGAFGPVTLSCSPERCASIVTPGDVKPLSETIAGQFQSREEIASKAVTGGSGGQQ